MFNLFGTRKEYDQTAKDVYNMAKPVSVPKKQNELYRVGVTADGMTTLTIMSTDGFSVTMSMNQNACKQMIRMLESTFTQKEESK